MASQGINSFNFSSGNSWILLISWLVLKPSKKCKKGIEPFIADKWATAARFSASQTLVEARIAKPVERVA